MDLVSGPVARQQPRHKSNKSSTSVLKSIITSKSHSKASLKGKENTTPPSTAVESPPARTPIWAEFSSASSQRPTSQVFATKLPLNDRTFEQEINLYTPKDYSPSKQQHYSQYERPSLARRDRPKSAILEKSKSAISVFDNFTRTISDNVVQNKQSQATNSRRVLGKTAKTMKVPLKAEGSTDKVVRATRSASRDLLTMAKKSSKVMGLVAAFNSKADDSSGERAPDAREIDAAFEALLESRNIPENMRTNLRTLKTSMKTDLIKGNDIDFGTMSKAKSAPVSIKEKAAGSIDGLNSTPPNDIMSEEQKKSTKRARARSKTFTFSKSSSPSKKAKGDDANHEGKGLILPNSASTVSLVGKGSLDAGKQAVPEEFVTYLRTEQKPVEIVVGKIHKLRQLLRNETVAWVETFIRLGGMTEIVSLLHRIMQVEWREEHEDQLLHETLLCLKALCTTDSALQKLCEIEQNLFSALLTMLFDPEHKGPSEFTTRGVIMNILLAHLNATVKDTKQLPVRAKTILSYVSDPLPPEDKRPIPFILDMRQSRPYKVWHHEVSNVTKEVFWIFLHHLNVVALPAEFRGANTKDFNTTQLARNYSSEEYIERYFPRPRPPVPAAPYVGGVEWDATNYIASHLDLLNGLIASLPTRDERNQLRRELQASGWEKLMGGTLRLCKEKFYDCIHDGLRTWVAAAAADGWEVRDVRMGPKIEHISSPRKSPKKKDDKPPVLDAPKFDIKLGMDDLDSGGIRVSDDVKQWI